MDFKRLSKLTFLIFFAVSCEKYGKHEWENPLVFEINKLPPRAHFFS